MVGGKRKSKRKWDGPLLRQAVAVAGFLGLAVYLVLPNFIRCSCRGPVTACKSNLKNIGTALEMYSTDFSGKYPRNLQILKPNYLKTVPVCPSAEYQTYRYARGLGAPGNPDKFQDFYMVECTGTIHADFAIPRDHPAYDGVQGLIER